jgi:outer membrane protein TolC
LSLALLLLLLGLSSPGLHAAVTYNEVLQGVVDHYPSLKTAAIQVERANQNSKKLASQLAWQLQADGGFARNVSIFGTEVDVIDANASVARKLESGSSFGIDTSISRADNALAFSPSLPNPATTTSIDLNYRQPLGQGAGNPAYVEGLKSAQAEYLLAQADRVALYDQIAGQIIELYSGAAVLHARLQNISRAIDRSKRRQAYIKQRAALGLSEDKDVLQVDAQLKSQQAEQRGLQMQWQEVKISLNRLMGVAWDSEFEPEYQATVSGPAPEFEKLFDQAQQHDPALKRVEARLQLADSALRSRRDAREDNLDLVMFVGNRSQQGDSTLGSVSDNVTVGGVRLEYGHGFDKSAEDSELYQAQLDRGAALQDKRQVLEDLQYNISSLLAQIAAGKSALTAYDNSVKSEQAKLDEAEQRYRSGRGDTDQLLQFESQLSAAELAYELQRVELLRRHYNLNLLSGTIWKQIQFPEFDNLMLESNGANSQQ